MTIGSAAAGRPRTVLAIVLPALILACAREAPSGRRSSSSSVLLRGDLRYTEPILAGFGRWQRCEHSTPADHVVEEAACGAPTIPPDLVSIGASECSRLMRTGQDARRLLVLAPPCTDAAVAMLEALAAPRRDPGALSDLAGAYLVRAQRNDQPEDLVRALDAAERAVQLAPGNRAARFNRALALESLGLAGEAVRDWDSLRRSLPAGWAEESAGHWSRLTRERTLSAAVQWPLNEQRLPEAAHAGDQAAVLQLVGPYRAAALRYVEETVLPAWASAAAEGRERQASEQLALAQRIAEALATLTGDRSLLRSVDQIRRSSGTTRETLRRGCLAFGDARRADHDLSSDRAEERYRKAEDAFTRAGSPMRFEAALSRATSTIFGRDYGGARALLRSLQREANRHGYPDLLARIHVNRGLLDSLELRFLDALAEYGQAQALFERTDDAENLNNVYTRKIGILRRIGYAPSTWRELLKAQRHTSSTLEQSSHLLLGESALSAVELGYPSVALLYQNAAVELIDEQLRGHADESRAAGLRRNLGVALRGRAGIRMRLDDYAGARADLDRALPLMGERVDPADAIILSGFRARIAEIQAQALAATDRRKAIGALNEAIAHASRTHYRSLLASLLLQRGELYRRERNRAAALRDLKDAVAFLREEQRAVLLGRTSLQGQEERLWSTYFSRSEEAYRQLIRQLVEDGAEGEAFDYAEKARAYEPLDLLLHRDAPSAFRKWVPDGEPLRLADVERALPLDTFLLQYCVLDDRTYVWIVCQGASERITLPAGEGEIANWTRSLLRFAASRDAEHFEAALAPPYAALVATPLARIARLRQGRSGPARVVFVPDRSMHGLPFAALRSGTRYVVQDSRVGIAASATLYAFSLVQDSRPPRGRESVLVVADPAFDPRLDVARGLQPLRGAEKEADRIERLYEPDVVVRRRSGREATVPELLKLARSSAVIHLAVHGIVNPVVPSRSFFLLAPAESDSGALDAERLVKELQIDHPRLAVLSACSSAGGTPIGPEGLAPLVRPMIAAGVPGVVGTLWNVSDNPATVELLVRFHRHYRDGEDADEALRRAQIEMIEDPDLERRSPIAWAPFQFVGFATSPFAHRATPGRR